MLTNVGSQIFLCTCLVGMFAAPAGAHPDKPKPNEKTYIKFEGKTVSAVVSPLGDQLVFNAGKKWPKSEVYVADLRGLNAKQLTRNHARNDQPCWRPDGKAIAFRSDVTGVGQIYSMTWMEETKSD